ncbi:hypothetical protein V6N13_120436 [Hibiscus sabdariffa]|uniref:F-box domain-containing protein n=1 Tax=Hibiscus sabdariffa TaxID=183260 RepID=A0ABR2E4A8_9ROSI
MKRCAPDSQVPVPDLKMKKVKEDSDEQEAGFMNLDENLLYEVLKHVDARTLAMASCVSKQWHKTAKDERLWELICTRHWANIGCGTQQLRSVVLPLGGFRRLHSLYLWPLSKPNIASASSSSSSWAPPFPKIINSKPPARWGKDEHICGLKKEKGQPGASGKSDRRSIDRIRFWKISLNCKRQSEVDPSAFAICILDLFSASAKNLTGDSEILSKDKWSLLVGVSCEACLIFGGQIAGGFVIFSSVVGTNSLSIVLLLCGAVLAAVLLLFSCCIVYSFGCFVDAV